MRGVFVLVIIVSFLSGYSQNDDRCAFPKDKKILKGLDKAHDDKLPAKEQYTALKEVLASHPDCAQCMYELGVRAFNNATERNSSYEYAAKYFSDLIDLCPQYCADPYYYMGVINYSEKNNPEAVKFFNLFLNFKSSNEFAYAEDHSKKISDVKEILPEIEFSENFYKNKVPFNPVLVDGVSSTGDEYLPMLSPDNQMIFYTRKFDKAAMGDLHTKFTEEFTLSLRDDISQPFDNGSALPKPFNIGPNYGGSTISIDNKEIIVCACQLDNKGTPREYLNCDLYSARYEKLKDPDSGKERYKWSELLNLGPNINTSNGWEAQPSLSADGLTLYYAANRYETKNTDIYYSTKNADGSWSKSRSMGEVINTNGNDKTPFIHTDSKTLYFTSETGTQRLGAGGYDIFYTRQDENGKWIKPVNIGNPINTPEDEHGLIVSTDGRMAYFTSGRLKGKGGLDIYRFELYPEARPEKVVIISGELKDKDGNMVSDAKVEIKYSEDAKIEEAHIDKDEGKFYAVVKTERPQDIVMTVKKEGHVFESKLLTIKELQKPVIKNNELVVAPIEVGKSYTINDILFATNSYELSAKSKFVIDGFVEFMAENPNVKVEIQGHTDNEGDPSSNLILSDNRANSVMQYISSKGIDAARLTFKGYGQTKPKVPNSNAENKAKNRRTEFLIAGM